MPAESREACFLHRLHEDAVHEILGIERPCRRRRLETGHPLLTDLVRCTCNLGAPQRTGDLAALQNHAIREHVAHEVAIKQASDRAGWE